MSGHFEQSGDFLGHFERIELDHCVTLVGLGGHFEHIALTRCLGVGWAALVDEIRGCH